MKICKSCSRPFWFASEVAGTCIGCANLQREAAEFERLRRITEIMAALMFATSKKSPPDKLLDDVIDSPTKQAERILAGGSGK